MGIVMSKFLSLVEDLYAGAEGYLKEEDVIRIASGISEINSYSNYNAYAQDIVDMFEGKSPIILTNYSELDLDKMIIDFIYFAFNSDEGSIISDYLDYIDSKFSYDDNELEYTREALRLFGRALYEKIILHRLSSINDSNNYKIVREFLWIYFNCEVEFSDFAKNMFLGRYDKATIRTIVDTLSSVGLDFICKDIRKYWSGDSTLYSNLRANIEYHNNCISDLWNFDEFMKDMSSVVLPKSSSLSNEFIPILEFLFISCTRKDGYIYAGDIMDRFINLTPDNKDIELFVKSMQSKDYSIYTYLDPEYSDEFEDELLRCRFDKEDSRIIDYIKEYALDTNLSSYKLEMMLESVSLFVNHYAFNRLLYNLENNKDSEYSNKAIDLINLYFLPQTVSFKKALYDTAFNLGYEGFDNDAYAKEILNIINLENWSFMKRFIRLYGDKTLPNYEMMADVYTSNKVALYNVDKLFMKAKEIILGDK